MPTVPKIFGLAEKRPAEIPGLESSEPLGRGSNREKERKKVGAFHLGAEPFLSA